jgi:hypothetical protein
MCIASLQKMSDSLESFNIVLSISFTILFFLSSTRFCCGVLDAKKCLLIPCISQNFLDSFEVNSPPLSYRKHLILRFVRLVSFSTSSLKILNLSIASDFFFRKEPYVILVYSSISNIN